MCDYKTSENFTEILRQNKSLGPVKMQISAYCRLCTNTTPIDSSIEIFGPIGLQFGINSIIASHLSIQVIGRTLRSLNKVSSNYTSQCFILNRNQFSSAKLSVDDKYSTIICTSCWRKIENFHTFYVAVEKAQSVLECQPQQALADFADDGSDFAAETAALESDSSVEVVEKSKIKTATKTTSIRAPIKTDGTKQAVKREKSEEDEKIRTWCNLYCTRCCQTFGNFPDVQSHYRTVHQENGYVMCCGRKYFRRIHLLDHIFKHINPDAFKCVTIYNQICLVFLYGKSNRLYFADVTFARKHLPVKSQSLVI